MTTPEHTSARGSLRPRLLSIVLAGSIAATLIALVPARSQLALPTASAASSGATPYSYGWPVKPFDREHPVRAVLGDPRTIFNGPPTVQGLLHAGGEFGFHQGIDISAPNGTAVYPVKSGVVTGVTDEWVGVDCGNGQSFKYWHIKPLVGVGDRVTLRQTVLGHVMRPAMHVHLTEYDHGRVTNPMAAGHIGPYTDTTAPAVTQIELRSPGSTGDALPNFVRGRVELIATASDLPTVPVPGIWNGLPTTPALLSWRIESLAGKVVVPEQNAYDHRSTLPPDGRFWSTYERGTFQNMAVFSSHYSYLQGGRYLFRLGSQPFDTRSLHDGVYELVVTATDIRGNSGSLSQRFTVHNRPGWIGS